MVFTNSYTEVLIYKFPGFSSSIELQEEIDLCIRKRNGLVSISFILSGLTSYVVDQLIAKNVLPSKEELDIYNFLEECRIKYHSFPDGTEEGDLDNAICNCFLENLINRAGSGQFKYSRFIPYLGEKSKEYCRAWDQYTGVRSEGLWTDEEWLKAKKGINSLK